MLRKDRGAESGYGEGVQGGCKEAGAGPGWILNQSVDIPVYFVKCCSSFNGHGMVIITVRWPLWPKRGYKMVEHSNISGLCS